MRPAVLLLLLALLVAGCAGDPDPTHAEAGLTMRGLVVDEAIVPVEGAEVLVVSGPQDNRTTRTDANGQWSFAGLSPGAVLLEFRHPDHHVMQLPVTVGPHLPLVRLMLPRLPADGGYHTTLSFDAFAEASLGAATVIVQAATGEEVACTCRFPIETGTAADAILLEAVWSDSLPPPQGRTTEYNWLVEAGPLQARGAGPSPLRHELQPIEFGDPDFRFSDARHYNVTVLPDALWPTVSQQYRVFVTLWHGEMVPVGWSVVAGDSR